MAFNGSLRDKERQFYQSIVSGSGTVEDLKAKYFEAQTGFTNAKDAEKQYLRSLGATGYQVDELWRSYLNKQGYTGTLHDMLHKFYQGGSFGTGYSLSFNGSSSVVTVPDSNSLDLTGNFTIALWLKPSSFGEAGSGRIIYKDAETSAGYGLAMQQGYFAITNTIMLVVNNTVCVPSISESITTGSWQHYVITYDGSNVRFYINGTKFGADRAFTTNPTANSSPLYIGDNSASTRAYDGNIYDVRIYKNRVLDATEASNLYAGTSPVQDGLVAHWKLNEGSGTTAYDETGYSNNGTITNGSYSSANPGITYTDYSLNFTSSDYVTFAGPAFGTAGSIAFWVNFSSTSGDTYIFDSSAANRYLFYNNTAKQWALYLNGTEVCDVTDPVSADLIDNDTWTHVCITWDNSLSTEKQKFYKNGILHSTRNINVATSGTPTNFYWNQRYTANARSAEKLDKFLVCNAAMTGAEVLKLCYYDTLPSSKIAYWNVNEGSGTTVNDYVGTNHGTVSGATWSTSVHDNPTQFTPSSISGLKLWLKSDTLSLNNNDAVATWTDSSGTGNDVTEATNRPTYKTGGQNNRPYVQFDGTNDILSKSSPTGLPSGSNARTVFMVATPRSLANYQPIYAYGAASNNQAFSLAFHSTTQLLSWGFSNDDLVTATSANSTTYYLMHQYTGANIVVRQNGVEKYNTADTINTGSTILTIGNYVNSLYPAPIDSYEILIFDTSLSSINIQNVEAYLASKYNL